jgi:hypothetical protein
MRASVSTARYAAQDSRPSGSLLLSRKAPLSSGSCRLSGKAIARIGLRMMPTFPSPPLKFRTASFLRYGFKAGISDKAFPKTWFAIVLRAHCFHRILPALCQGRCAGKAPPCERTHPPTRGAHPDFAAERLMRDALDVPIRIGLGARSGATLHLVTVICGVCSLIFPE